MHYPVGANVLLDTPVYSETSWAVKLFLFWLRTPGLRAFNAGHFLQEDEPEAVGQLIASDRSLYNG